MKLAVISDIHGNSAALTAIYNALDKAPVDGIIYLGDYLTGFPEPQKVLDLMAERAKATPSYYIRGNWDHMMVNRPDDYKTQWDQNIWMGVALYALEKISKEQFDFLSELKIADTFVPEGCPAIACCHGSPDDVGESLAPDTDRARELLANLEGNILLCGHTHNQYRYDCEGKTLLNPGSAGLPGLGATKARFAVIEPTEDGWNHEFFALDYDLEALKKDLIDSKMEEVAMLRVPVMVESVDVGEDLMVKSVPFTNAAAAADGVTGGPAAAKREHWLLGLKQAGLRDGVL